MLRAGQEEVSEEERASSISDQTGGTGGGIKATGVEADDRPNEQVGVRDEFAAVTDSKE